MREVGWKREGCRGRVKGICMVIERDDVGIEINLLFRYVCGMFCVGEPVFYFLTKLQ